MFRAIIGNDSGRTPMAHVCDRYHPLFNILPCSSRAFEWTTDTWWTSPSYPSPVGNIKLWIQPSHISHSSLCYYCECSILHSRSLHHRPPSQSKNSQRANLGSLFRSRKYGPCRLSIHPTTMGNMAHKSLSLHNFLTFRKSHRYRFQWCVCNLLGRSCSHTHLR